MSGMALNPMARNTAKTKILTGVSSATPARNAAVRCKTAAVIPSRSSAPRAATKTTA